MSSELHDPIPTPTQPGPGLLKAVGWVIVLVLFQTACVIAAAVVTGRQDSLTLLPFATSGTLLVAMLIVGLKYGRAAREKLAIRRPGWTQLALVILLTTPLILALGEATASLADAARWVGVPNGLIDPTELLGITDAIRQDRSWSIAIAIAVFGGLMPAVGEELFFRGFLGRGLVARWGLVGGVLLTAFLFAAMHLHPLHATIAGLMGLILHAVYLWTRSLAAPMVLHGVYNCQAFLGNELTRGTRYDLAADEHLPPILALTAIAAAVGLVYLLYRSRVRWVRADGTNWSPGFTSAETPPVEADARLVGDRLRARQIAVVAVLYLLLVAALGWEISR